MTFLEKLDFLMYKNGINKDKFSILADIPYTTIDGWYKRGYANMTVTVFKKVCDYFHVTMDSMARDEIEEVEFYDPASKDFFLNPTEKQIIIAYRKSDIFDQTSIQRTLHIDVESEKKETA